ncbi:MAG TPA: type II toxin-antitoxin system Phd/YefM family antitoxin [Microthrixaceae bacterium]|nr:type II toxin-antitoxin system Phd/YefM family antitoxin [Microthrixaceae bacterium]
MSTMTVSQARAALPEILDRVLAGEEVTVTRHGQPVAVIVRPDSLRSRRADDALAQAETVGALIAEGSRRTLRTRPRLSSDRADALVAEARSSRRGR